LKNIGVRESLRLCTDSTILAE